MKLWLPPATMLALVSLALPACVDMGAPTPLADVSAETRDQLRQDVPALSLAIGLLVVGVVASALAAYHWAAVGSELLSFGVFSFLYGVRLVSWTPISRLLIDLPPYVWGYLDAVITYFLPVVILFFLEPFMGRVRWVHWLWRVQLIYAFVATVVDIATRSPFRAMGPYRVLVLTWFVVAIYFIYFRRQEATRELKVVRAGLLVFVVLAGHATLSGIVPIWTTTSAEPLGLFVFFLTLGYVVVDRFFTSQRELVAVGQELETAWSIQQKVLPQRLPEVEGLELAVRYVPVSAVAGDFYDYLQSERGLSLLVADVSGHGVPAALIASMVKIAYSAQLERIHKPSAVLSEINRILCGKIRGQFVTGACLFFDAEERRLSYASAGHPPLVRVRSGGDASEVELDSVLMGFLAEATYRETEVELRAGDKLVLYTDGITEAQNQSGDFYGVERLLTLLEARSDDDAETLASAIVDGVRSWSGRRFDDDVTLVVVERI